MLRHLTLKILKDQSMSGSEIVEKIEEYTDWRPSPGSIYPLLAHLQEEGFIKPHPDEDLSLKRFALTENGIKILEEHKWFDDHFKNRQKSIRKIYWMLHREMPEDLYESLATLLDTVEETYRKASASPEASRRFREILEQAVSQLTEIVA